MGSDERHFNVSLIVGDKVTGQCMSANHNLFQKGGEPKWIRTEVLLLTSLTPHRWANPAHFIIIIIIIMYIHRALINALSAHIIDIHLNMIFYTQDILHI